MTHPAETWHDAVADADAVARVLATLDPAEWTIYRDVRWPTREFASLDHVVVGPKGVFVIDSLGWSGRVNVAKDQVRLNGYVRDSELVGAVEAAADIAELLASVDPCEVQPVLCFVREEWLTGTARGVLVCSTANLDSMMRGRSSRLRPERLRAITRQLDRYDAVDVAYVQGHEPLPDGHSRSCLGVEGALSLAAVHPQAAVLEDDPTVRVVALDDVDAGRTDRDARDDDARATGPPDVTEDRPLGGGQLVQSGVDRRAGISGHDN